MSENKNIDLDTMIMNTDISNLDSKTKSKILSLLEYKELQMYYTCALKEVKTKIEVLSTEFNVQYKRNPISSIETRLKSTKSIITKLRKKNIPITLKNIKEQLSDIAGIRVICSYIDDIYIIADALLKQDDIVLIEKKDYIVNPKPNGYRSLHLIIQIPIFLSTGKKNVKVEVQIRTIAMNFWASLEHQIKYKKKIENQEEISKELIKCSEIINETDEKMLSLRKQIEMAEDLNDDDTELIERFKKIDVPIE